MKPWVKKKSLVRGIRFLTELEPMEREMLGDSAATVGERLIGRARSAPKDELAEMTGLPSGHTDAPDDPSLAALLPSFFRDGDEEVEGESGVSRQFNETDIIKAKLLNLRVVGDKLGPDGSVHVSLTEREVRPWLGALADIRTFHNAELERFRADLDPESREVAAAENYLEWLGYHQDSLLTALMGSSMFPTSEPGPVNGLADVTGIFLGHAEVDSSGVTVVACPDGAVGAVDVRGGGPGTRETDLLKPSNSMESVHAVALCGGSAFGLDAAGGVMAGLEARGIGFPVFGEGVPGPIVPIVPAAVIFDLPVGESSSRPTAETGRAALDNATDSTTDSVQDAAAALGNVGAGHAAVAGAVKGGFGEASSVIAGEPGSLPGAGRTVAVGLVVNPVGSIADPSDGTLWSAAVAQEHPVDLGGDGTGGTLPEPTEEGLAAFLERGMAGMKFPSGAPESLNTTIGVVATDAPVTKAQAERLAMAVHDGLSRAIRPAHLPMDGDTVFALAPSGVRTGQSAAASDNTGSDNASDTVDQMELAVLSAAAATCAERAVARAVLNADSAFGIPAWADIITGGTP